MIIALAASLIGMGQTIKRDVVQGCERHSIEYQTSSTIRFGENDQQFFWECDGEMKTAFGHADGRLLHGEYKCEHRDHGLTQSGSFAHGLRNGIWFFYSPGGFVREKSHWKLGRRHGITEVFDGEGGLIRSDSYRKGVVEVTKARTGRINFFKRKIRLPKPRLEPIKEVTNPEKED